MRYYRPYSGARTRVPPSPLKDRLGLGPPESGAGGWGMVACNPILACFIAGSAAKLTVSQNTWLYVWWRLCQTHVRLGDGPGYVRHDLFAPRGMQEGVHV